MPVSQCAIFDIDGTLIEDVNRKKYKKTNRDFFHTNAEIDSVILYNIAVLKVLKKCGISIVLISGKDAKYKSYWENWLKENFIPYDLFLTRKKGDTRETSIVKAELAMPYVDNCMIAVDDREDARKAYSSIGIENVVSELFFKDIGA